MGAAQLFRLQHIFKRRTENKSADLQQSAKEEKKPTGRFHLYDASNFVTNWN